MLWWQAPPGTRSTLARWSLHLLLPHELPLPVLVPLLPLCLWLPAAQQQQLRPLLIPMLLLKAAALLQEPIAAVLQRTAAAYATAE